LHFHIYSAWGGGKEGVDPGVGKGKGINRLSVARWLEKIELAKLYS